MTKPSEKEEFSDTFKSFVVNKETSGPEEKVRKRKTPLRGDGKGPGRKAAKTGAAKPGPTKKSTPKKSTPQSSKIKSEEEEEASDSQSPAPEPEEIEEVTKGRPSRRASLKAQKALKEELEDEVATSSEEEVEDMSNSEVESEWDAPEVEEEKPKRGRKRKAPSTPVKKDKKQTPKSGGGRGRRGRAKAPSPSEEDEDFEDEEEDDLDGLSESDEDGSDANAENNNQSMSDVGPQEPVTEIPFEKDLALKESFFECGKFLVNRADFKLCEYPSLWRMDGKSLIQKYEFTKVDDGQPKYRSISTYAGYNQDMRRLYYPCTTKHVAQEKNEHVVNFKKSFVDFSFSDKMHTSVKSSEDLKEAFEVYLQALVTYSLESSFFEEIIKDNDRYFLDAIDKIEGESKKRLEKMRPGLYWGDKITEMLDKYPLTNCHTVPMVSGEKCQSCKERTIVRKIDLKGGEYDPLVLKVDETTTSATPLSVCVQCIDAILVYHRFTHGRLISFRACDFAVQKMKDHEKVNPEILETLLNDADWIQKYFREMQVYWAEADIMIDSLEKYTAGKTTTEQQPNAEETGEKPDDEAEASSEKENTINESATNGSA